MVGKMLRRYWAWLLVWNLAFTGVLACINGSRSSRYQKERIIVQQRNDFYTVINNPTYDQVDAQEYPLCLVRDIRQAFGIAPNTTVEQGVSALERLTSQHKAYCQIEPEIARGLYVYDEWPWSAGFKERAKEGLKLMASEGVEVALQPEPIKPVSAITQWFRDRFWWALGLGTFVPLLLSFGHLGGYFHDKLCICSRGYHTSKQEYQIEERCSVFRPRETEGRSAVVLALTCPWMLVIYLAIGIFSAPGGLRSVWRVLRHPWRTHLRELRRSLRDLNRRNQSWIAAHNGQPHPKYAEIRNRIGAELARIGRARPAGCQAIGQGLQQTLEEIDERAFDEIADRVDRVVAATTPCTQEDLAMTSEVQEMAS